MSKSVNEVRILGHLGQDPDIRATQSGTTVANLSVATSERRKDASGNWEDHTEWHRLVAFGKTADAIGTYCRKGDRIHVSGRLQTRKWQDQSGTDRYSTEIIIDDAVFLGQQGQGQAAPRAPEPAREARPTRQPAQQPTRLDDFEDSEITF